MRLWHDDALTQTFLNLNGISFSYYLGGGGGAFNFAHILMELILFNFIKWISILNKVSTCKNFTFLHVDVFVDVVNLDLKSTLRVLYNLFTKYKGQG